jgi:hypothetical protein
MPIHDWKSGYHGVFHDFHQTWIVRIKEALNKRLPKGYYALTEQSATGGPKSSIEADILALHSKDIDVPSGGTLTAERPKAKIEASSELARYARKQSRVAIRHTSHNRVVAVVEVVSPGNKNRRLHFSRFVRKAVGLLERGVHLSVFDILTPTRPCPRGVHAAIWEELGQEAPPFDPAFPYSSTGYNVTDAGTIDAFVEPLSLGSPLVDVPIFLHGSAHVMIPSEETYLSAWEAVPEYCQAMILAGRE